MKKYLIFFACLFGFFFARAQDLPPAPSDSAVVYIVRTSSLGFAINFSYFDSAALIARLSGVNYVRYSCKPGNHLFWARSENRSFVEAEVEAGNIYFLLAVPQLGGFKSGVELLPVDASDVKTMEKILKLMKKEPAANITPGQLANDATELQEVIQRGLEKYAEEKSKNKPVPKLTPEMAFKLEKPVQ